MPPEHAVVPEMPKQATRVGKRVNRVIDMWLEGQPVYYTQVGSGGYEQGKALAATKADSAGVKFLNACNENSVIDQLKDGVMICTGGDTPVADKGRAFTKRVEPW
jgi:hypothetical protein